MADRIAGQAREGYTQYNEFLETYPSTGSGNADANWNTTKENSGRNPKSVSARYRDTTSAGLFVTLNITQKGKPVFINLTSPSQVVAIDGETRRTSYDVNPSGATISFKGTTNAKKLRYALNEDASETVFDMEFATLSATYTANNGSATNNTNIVNDPGGLNNFEFTIPLTVLNNLSVSSKYGSFSIYAFGDDQNTATTIHIQLQQRVGDSFLWIDKTNTTTASITLDYTAGSTASRQILSNTNWELVQ